MIARLGTKTPASSQRFEACHFLSPFVPNHERQCRQPALSRCEKQWETSRVTGEWPPLLYFAALSSCSVDF
jgi:hypothetical protein